MRVAGAKLMGASLIIGVDGDEVRLAMARRMGADVVLDFTRWMSWKRSSG